MNYLFLQNTPGQEDFTTRQIKNTLLRLGHTARNLWTSESGAVKTKNEIIEEINFAQPDRIVWNGTEGFTYTELFNAPYYRNIPKIVLFYDDPISMIRGTPAEFDLRLAAGSPSWHFFVWDAYWIAEMKRLYGIHCHHTQLAIDPTEIYRQAPIPAFRNHLVFVGMLHSRKAILHNFKTLPPPLQKIAQSIDTFLNGNLDNLLRRYLPARHVADPLTLIQSHDPIQAWAGASNHNRRRLQWIVWALAKNAARITMLRLALRTTPVVMFTETIQLGHASQDEIHELLSGETHGLTIINTSYWSPAELSRAYSSGMLHLNATDPQSVDGGIPYRVFQTLGCGAVLLTDTRPELLRTFAPKETLLTYDPLANDGLLDGLVDATVNYTPAQLQELGQRAQHEIIRAHTWEHRLADIEEKIKTHPADSSPTAHSADLGPGSKMAEEQLC